MQYQRVKPRKNHDHNGTKYLYDSEISGYENLAFAIVHQAKLDAERLGGNDCVRYKYQWIRKDELIRFFESAWCDTLLGRSNITGADIKEKLGL